MLGREDESSADPQVGRAGGRGFFAALKVRNATYGKV